MTDRKISSFAGEAVIATAGPAPEGARGVLDGQHPQVRDALNVIADTGGRTVDEMQLFDAQACLTSHNVSLAGQGAPHAQ